MLNRRAFLRAAASASAVLAQPGFAGQSRIERLMDRARDFAFVGERIAFISRALVGAPYLGHTLVGGPDTPERLVTREDGFDCVTFCETVLAAARARTPDEFAVELRRIRYQHGRIDWFARNHYFSEWAQNNVENDVVLPLLLPGSEWRKKTLTYIPELGVRSIVFAATPRESFAAYAYRLASGDIVAFLSRQPGLDYFHVGFVIVASDGALWLRHASLSYGRVVDEPLAHFCMRSGVAFVTLLRPQEVAGRAMII